MPGSPGVTKHMRRKHGIETGTLDRYRPCPFELPAGPERSISVSSAAMAEYAPFSMWQLGQRGDHTRRQLNVPPLARFRLPEDRTAAQKVDILPFQRERLARPCAGAKQEDHERFQPVRRGRNQPFRLGWHEEDRPTL